jgi:hypothetical protein
MEAVERHAQLLHEFKRHAGAILGVLDGIGTIVPGHLPRADAERIGIHVSKAMPVSHRESQVLGHSLAVNHFGRVVVLERSGFLTWALVNNLLEMLLS